MEKSKSSISSRTKYFIRLKSRISLVKSNSMNWKNNDCTFQRKSPHYSLLTMRREQWSRWSYKKLLDAITSIPIYNVILAIGDFNPHARTNNTFKYTYHRNSNQNSILLIGNSEETSMMIANTFFRKSTSKFWTFMSDSSGAKTQVE